MSKKLMTFPLYVCTQWTSTFKLLKFCLKYKDVMRVLYSTKMFDDPLENVEWEWANICLQFL